jgi:hypothetical protein
LAASRRKWKLHGPISTGPSGNRVYFGYGTNKGGVLQIVDREKLLNGPKEPTPENLKYPEIGRLDLLPLNGVHTAIPLGKVKIPEFAKDLAGGIRDIVMVVNESLVNECQANETRQMVWFVDATVESRPMVVSPSLRRRSASAYSAAAPGPKTGGPNTLTVGDGLLWRLPRVCARIRSSSARSAASTSPTPGDSHSHVTSLGASSLPGISGASSSEATRVPGATGEPASGAAMWPLSGSGGMGGAAGIIVGDVPPRSTSASGGAGNGEKVCGSSSTRRSSSIPARMWSRWSSM